MKVIGSNEINLEESTFGTSSVRLSANTADRFVVTFISLIQDGLVYHYRLLKALLQSLQSFLKIFRSIDTHSLCQRFSNTYFESVFKPSQLFQ